MIYDPFEEAQAERERAERKADELYKVVYDLRDLGFEGNGWFRVDWGKVVKAAACYAALEEQRVDAEVCSKCCSCDNCNCQRVVKKRQLVEEERVA